jgi:hypothetical protein
MATQDVYGTDASDKPPIYGFPNTDTERTPGNPGNPGNPCTKCDESAALTALEAMIKSLEDVVKLYPTSIYNVSDRATLDRTYSVPPVAFIRLKWIIDKNPPITGSIDDTFKLLDMYMAYNLRPENDPLLVKLIAHYNILI